MTRTTIDISTSDGTAEAYVSRPDEGEHPAVLLYMDAIGLRPRLEEMADRIASWGFVVMVPNVFYRDGTAAELRPTEDLTVPANREAFFGSAMARVGAYTPDRFGPDLDAFLGTLLALPGVAGSEIGVIGYCMGGRLALRATGQYPAEVAAIGLFHGGGLVTYAPDSPHLAVAGARAEVLAGHADNDGSNGPEQIAALDAALEAAGLTYTTAVYQGASHGYSMSDTSAYDEAATERHFRELEALLGRTLRD